MANRAAHAEMKLLLAEAQAALNRSQVQILTDLAFQAEAHAKNNLEASGRVDTGFALNSIHALPPGAEAGAAESAVLADKNGRLVRRSANATPALKGIESAVAVGADYGIWLEIAGPFLAPAGQQVKADLKAIAEKAKL